MKNSALRFILCAAVAIILSLNASAQTQVGQIKAAKIEGDVLKLNKDGTSTPVHANDALTESDVITTGKGASVVLVFMNGSSVKLGADSRLAIDEFKVDPLAEDVDMSKLTRDSAETAKSSKTALNLSYGELVGDVKHLNTSSTYSIKTPVGAAGIRGTIFRIVFRPDANGKAFFTVSTLEGLVVVQGVTNQEIPIANGKEVVVEINVPDTPGGTAAPPVIVTQDIPPATATLINAASQTITQTVKDATFTPPTSPPPTTPPPTPPPPPQTPPTSLTPGAGGG